MTEPALPENIVCPVCGTTNPGDGIFCDNCHKAIGDFRFVREEVLALATWHENVAERVTLFIGKPYFLITHAVWFLLWVVLNTGAFALIHRFDDYPYSLLGIILSVEAIFITGFLLISQNRQSAFADKRAELDYEVNVRTYRRLNEIEEIQQRILFLLERSEDSGKGSPS